MSQHSTGGQPSQNPFLAAALGYARRGWKVFPLRPGTKDRPMTRHGSLDATTDPDTIWRWWTSCPTANVGIATGGGLMVLDVDLKDDGPASLRKLEADHGELPDTVNSLTPSGGYHYYFTYPADQDIRNSAGKLAPGLDIRGEGGYVVAPPSVGENGKPYAWEVTDHPPDTAVGPAPAWLLEMAQAKPKAERRPFEMPDKVAEGQRNAVLFKLAASLRAKGTSPVAIRAALDAENAAACDPPLDSEEVGKIAESARRYPAGHSPATTSRFVLTPLSALLAEQDEAIAWVWCDTLPSGGLSIVAAKPKVGKSTFARNLALAVARGEPFLERATSQGPVVVLCLEDKRAEVRIHFDRMGATTEPIYVQVGPAPERGVAALEEAIREAGAVLAIVDPLFRLVRLRDGNDYAEVTRGLEPLLTLARTTRCHILAVHHESKGAASREAGDGILGSTALFGSVDCGLFMRKREDRSRTIESVQRYGVDLPKLVLALNEGTGLVEAAGTADELERQRVSGDMMEALAGGDLTEPELRKLVAGRTKAQSEALRQLVADGSVTREGRGRRGDPYRYSLVPDKCGEQENKIRATPEEATNHVMGGRGPEQETASEPSAGQEPALPCCLCGAQRYTRDEEGRSFCRAHSPPDSPCPVCKGLDWWLAPGSVWRCERCHPQPGIIGSA